MFDSKLWRYIFLTAILEIVIIIIISIVLIAFYPAYSIYIILGSLGVIILYLWISYHIYKPVFEHKVVQPQDEIIGNLGVAITDLNPRGQVKIRDEAWSARSVSGFIISGSKIKVIQIEGIQLIVDIQK